MIEAVQPLAGERHERETDKAVTACNDYLRMGAGRSLAKLDQRYRTETEMIPPTKRLATLKAWSTGYGWQERAALYDAEIERQKDEQSQENLKKYLALDGRRVEKLFRLADFLEGQIYDEDEGGNFHNVWVRDVKGIGSKEDFERVEIERFNAPLIAEFRAALDDIAKETGGRVKKSDVTSGGKTVPIAIVKMDMDEL